MIYFTTLAAKPNNVCFDLNGTTHCSNEVKLQGDHSF